MTYLMTSRHNMIKLKKQTTYFRNELNIWKKEQKDIKVILTENLKRELSIRKKEQKGRIVTNKYLNCKLTRLLNRNTGNEKYNHVI